MQSITRKQHPALSCLRRTPLVDRIRLRARDLEVHFPLRIMANPFFSSLHDLLTGPVQLYGLRVRHSPEWRSFAVGMAVLVLAGVDYDSPVYRVNHEVHKGPVVFLDEVVVHVCAYHPEFTEAVALEGDAQAAADATISAVGADNPVCREEDIVAGRDICFMRHQFDFV